MHGEKLRLVGTFLAGFVAGVAVLSVAMALGFFFLPRFLAADHEPSTADAVIVLGGDSGGIRLRRGIELVEQEWARRLILVSSNKQGWLHLAQKYCPDCRLEEREVAYLEGSVDTRTDAQLSLDHCRENGLRRVLVVTSPYHSRRSQIVFNDIYARSGVEPVVVSSRSYGQLVPPEGPWWSDRRTLENVWLEFGKILFWELTPYMEWPRAD